MKFDREKRRSRRAQTDEAIHIIALWNLMLILIPFLLLSAAFSQTAILNLFIPSSRPVAGTNPASAAKDPIQLSITPKGFLISQGSARQVALPVRSGHFDFPGLKEALAQFKSENPSEESIVLSSSPHISYDAVIQAMDRCREARFPNILLGSDAAEG